MTILSKTFQYTVYSKGYKWAPAIFFNISFHVYETCLWDLAYKGHAENKKETTQIKMKPRKQKRNTSPPPPPPPHPRLPPRSGGPKE